MYCGKKLLWHIQPENITNNPELTAATAISFHGFLFIFIFFFPDAGTVAAFLGTLLFPPSCFFIFLQDVEMEKKDWVI